MGVFEIISIIMLVLTVGFSIWTITKIIKKSRYVKNIENKIRLKNKTFNASYIWIILLPLNLLNIHLQIEKFSAQGNLSRERCYIYLGICYIILLILFFIVYVSGRYSYISENCFISSDFNKISLDNSALTYRTDNDILEIYYKENKTISNTKL